MYTTFLNASGVVQFVRDDMEQGSWTQEEYTMTATFPYVSGKVITRGMRISFPDPATGSTEIFEIRNVTNIEPDHYQQIIAENIAVSELSDDHCNNTEITDKTAAQALGTVLNGTLWSVGTSTVSGSSSVDIARGSVWQAVNAISTNWNAYITPRVTVNASGSITGRYLDITPAQGTYRGVRLSIDKNMSDSSVVYDDSEVYTALYGYGGSVEKTHTGQDDTTEELTFADVVWTATSEHPAKPSGQTYLDWPEKTALYGRNGRPRFGYYQNGDITDANILLQKTWDELKIASEPKISITGTVSDLYRLGYKDQPLRLHDTVIVDVSPTGEHFELEVIRLDVDLIDPTSTHPEIGSYIPNIIYINRETNTTASGGGGGGGHGQKNTEYELSETYSGFEKTDAMIAMVVGTRNGDNYIKAGEIGLAINKSGESGSYESTAYINANHVNISATNTAYSLAGDMEHDADGKLVIKSAGGMYVQRTESGVTSKFGVFDNGNLTGGVIVDKVNGSTSTYITGDHVNISATSTVKTIAGEMEVDANGRLVIKSGGGLYAQRTVSGQTAQFGLWDAGNLTGGVMVQQINGQSGTKLTLGADVIDINGIVTALLAKQISVQSIHTTTGSNLFEGHNSFPDTVAMQDLTYANQSVDWQTYNARRVSLSNSTYVCVATTSGGNPAGTKTGYVVTGYSDTVLHYLGYPDS